MKKHLLVLGTIGVLGMAAHAATLAHWTFEGGTIGQKATGVFPTRPYTDVSGNGNDMGVYVSSQHATYVAAPDDDTAVSFNAWVSTRPAIMTDTTQPLDSYDFSGSGWTVECTFKPFDSTRGWQTVMGKMGNPNPGSGNLAPRLRLLARHGVDSDSRFEGGFWDSNNDWQWIQSIEPLQNGVWYSVAMVYDDAANTCSLWLSTDGGPYILQGSFSHTAGASLVQGVDVRDDGTTVFDPEWKLGAGMWNGNWDTDYFFGEIAEARVSSGALAPDLFIAPVQDRLVILRDDFSNLHGIDVASDWDLLCRQSGIETPNWCNPGGVLTVDGRMKVTTNIVHTGASCHTIDDRSFTISWDASFDPSAGGAENTVLTLQGLPGQDNGIVWSDSPISVVLFEHNWIHCYAGDLDNGGVSMMANLDPGTISATIGETYAVTNKTYHYEIEVLADSDTNGVWNLYVNGSQVAGNLPYAYRQPMSAQRVVAWWPSAGAGCVSYWDNLEIAYPQFKGGVFVDSFDTSDTTDLNQDAAMRQAAGDIDMGYAHLGSNSANWQVKDGAFFAPSSPPDAVEGRGDYNFAPDIVGRDFELSFDVTVTCDATTNGGWAALYLVDSSLNIWGSDSDFGIHVLGTNSGSGTAAFYLNDSATGEPVNHIVALSDAQIQTATGEPYDPTQTHHIQLVSTYGAGPAGANLVDFIVDGVTVVSNLVYDFADDTVRRLQFNNSLGDAGGGGIYFDNVSVRVLSGFTAYQRWAARKGLGGPDGAVGADWELDGYSNFEEFAFMGDPKGYDNPDAITGYVVGGGSQTITYIRRTDLAPLYEVLYSTTAPGSWEADIGPESPLGPPYVDFAATIAPIDGEYEQVDVDYDTSLPKFFLGVKATDR